jgi:hypothetical protein
MKETNRVEILKSLDNLSFDLAYKNPGLKEIIEALQAVLTKQRVILLFTDDIKRDDDWRFISTLPKNIFNLPTGLVQLKRFKQWGNLAPHLFRPVKTIYAGRSISNWYLKITDLLFGNDFQKRSSQVAIADIPDLGSLLKVHRKGLVFQDYKVNISRLKMELLKEIHLIGGVVINHAEISNTDGKLLITDNVHGGEKVLECSSLSITPENMQKIYHTKGLPWPDFTIRIKSGKNELRMYDYHGKLAIATEPDTSYETFLKAFSFVWKGNLPELIEEDQTNDKINFQKMIIPRFLRDYVLESTPDRMEKRPVEDLMETAFDIAKQTGIGFQEFRTLYFRYGKGIDWMTERAYEWMTKERDTKIIWSRVEIEYAAEFEWGKNSINTEFYKT